jgi:hypothetical protein
MSRYAFRQSLGAFFLGEANIVRTWLPRGLTPFEMCPGHAMLAITAFDFIDSEVGPYGELVVSVLVAPFASRGHELPHAASYPVLLATTTPESRAHASEQWYLPRHERCMEMNFAERGGRRTIDVFDAGERVLSLSIQHGKTTSSVRLYQVFSAREGVIHRVNVRISGGLDEHQDESGELHLHAHPWARRIADVLLDDHPIMEQSMDLGEEERIGDLVPHLLESS